MARWTSASEIACVASGDHGIDRGVEAFEGNPLRRHRVHIKTRVIDRRALIMRARHHRELLIDDQGLEQKARVTATKQMRQHFERLGIARCRRFIGWYKKNTLQSRLFDLFVGERYKPMRAGLRLARAKPFGRRATGRD